MDAAFLGSCPAFTRPGADQFSFKLSEAPSTVEINRPCGVLVSAQCVGQRLEAGIASSTLSRSLVLRARRLSRVTVTAVKKAAAWAGWWRGFLIGVRRSRLLASQRRGFRKEQD
jgi:hypothetical protein